MRYFQALYAQETSELILLNNANYHCPFDAAQATQLDWPDNPLELERLNMTAFISISPLTDWPAGRRYLHGHSRGAAVVLRRAAKPRCDSSERRIISAFWRLPFCRKRASPAMAQSPATSYLLLFDADFFRSYACISRDRLVKMPMMQPNNELKTRLCLSIFTTPQLCGLCDEFPLNCQMAARDRL